MYWTIEAFIPLMRECLCVFYMLFSAIIQGRKNRFIERWTGLHTLTLCVNIFGRTFGVFGKTYVIWIGSVFHQCFYFFLIPLWTQSKTDRQWDFLLTEFFLKQWTIAPNLFQCILFPNYWFELEFRFYCVEYNVWLNTKQKKIKIKIKPFQF